MALRFLSLSAAAALAVVAAPAFAKGGPPKPSPAPTPTAQPSLGGCAGTIGTIVQSSSQVANGASACSGFYAGNVLSGNEGDVLTQKAAVAALGGSFDGNFGALTGFSKLNGLNGGTLLNFGTTFYGDAIIGAHFGNGNAITGQNSVFWAFDFGSAGASSLSFINAKALSNLYIYGSTTPPETAVPEPAAWALMILGFGVVGSVLRRSKKTKLALTYA